MMTFEAMAVADAPEKHDERAAQSAVDQLRWSANRAAIGHNIARYDELRAAIRRIREWHTDLT